MNVSQLLVLIDELYKDNAASDTTKIRFMNMAQSELSPYFGIIVTDSTLVTVATQDYYTFPTGLSDITQIELLDIGNKVVPTNRYDYTRYTPAYKEDDPVQYNSYRQEYSSIGVKSLILYPVPATSGYPIRIRYHRKLTELSSTSLSAEPEFDERFHDMLATYAAYMICSTGASPDENQSNRFMDQYNESLNMLWKLSMEQDVIYPRKRRDNKHWRV
jgi:hypothetical protein